ncbi:MAG TPA: ABC transporter ATP-binding protein [Anaerolineaceae bacterium]|nr:ABC transporter ATP-binding protein [Anaerolineaceae bacterium]
MAIRNTTSFNVPAHPAKSPGGGTGKVPRNGLGRAIGYLGHYKRIAFFAYGALVIATGAQLMVPQLVQSIIDAITKGLVAQELAKIPAAYLTAALTKLGWTTDQYNTYQNGWEYALAIAGLLILIFAVLRGLFSYAQTYMNERVSQSVAFDLRNDLFAKIQRLSFSYHDKNQTGQLMIRATDDVEKVRLFIGQGLLFATQAVILLVATLLILFLTNVNLTLIIIPLLPVSFLIFYAFGKISTPMFTQVQIRLSRLNTILQENMAGIKVIKAFVREPEQEQRFEKSANDLLAQQIKLARVFAFLFPLVFLVSSLGQAAVQYFGGRQIIMNTLTLGEWQKFSLYLMFIFLPLGMLGMIINLMSQASASADRIFEILDAKSDVVDKPGAFNLPEIQGSVQFHKVSFRYFGTGEPALDNVSFDAEPGQTIALLGATGSGKSTIINLIPRFYDVTTGSITIDRHDIRNVCLDSLRAQIGIVLQDTTLFSGSIRDNIAFGRPTAGMDEVIAAAKAAKADDFIISFPNGYETSVGERGATLSGGQKQRIAIARALLMDPRILILDDSTSSVDNVTEFEIQQTLSKLMKGRTSFVIAQRISTVRNADKILVLDKGKLVAMGKHEDLMENSPIYAEIYSSQLVEDAPASLETLSPLTLEEKLL